MSDPAILPLVFGLVVYLVLVIPPYWMIWKRSGHNGAWSLFLLIPVTSMISMWILGFKSWPAYEERQ